MLIILKASLIDFQCIFVEIHNMHGFSWVLVYEVLLKIFMDFHHIDERSYAERLIEVCPLDEEDSPI